MKAIAEELVQKGRLVVMLIDSLSDKGMVAPEEKDGILFYYWPAKFPGKLRNFPFICRLLRQYRPLSVTANFNAVNQLIFAAWLFRVPERIVWTRSLSDMMDWQGIVPVYRKARPIWRKKWMLKLVTRVAGISQAVLDDLNRVYGIPKNKMELIYNKLKDPLKEKSFLSAQPAGQRRIICPARIWPVKAQDVLIKAVALLKPSFPDLTARFVGGGGMLPYCKELAEKLGVKNNCYFPGNMSHDDFMKEITCSWFSVLPSRSEGLGWAIIESMALGVPVIASKVGGIPEVIRDGQDGFLVPPDDPAELAEKMKILLSNPELRQTMSRNARARFLERFELCPVYSTIRCNIEKM